MSYVAASVQLCRALTTAAKTIMRHQSKLCGELLPIPGHVASGCKQYKLEVGRLSRSDSQIPSPTGKSYPYEPSQKESANSIWQWPGSSWRPHPKTYPSFDELYYEPSKKWEEICKCIHWSMCPGLRSTDDLSRKHKMIVYPKINIPKYSGGEKTAAMELKHDQLLDITKASCQSALRARFGTEREQKKHKQKPGLQKQ